MPKERIDIENIDGQLFEIKIIEHDDSKPASFTHYLHNHKNGVSQFNKKDALSYVTAILEKEYPATNRIRKVPEEALQYLLFDLDKTVPFPAAKKPEFKFIDLFAGMGRERNLVNDDRLTNLGVTLSGRAFGSNLFARSSQKGFPPQSLTQKLVA